MLRSLARVAATIVLSASSAVLVASPAAAEDCVTVDGAPVLCLGAAGSTNRDTSNGATVSPSLDVDVCTSLLRDEPTCDRGAATLTFGPTGLLLNGVTVAPAQVGGTPVHVPQVCLNSSPCVGPYDYTVPPIDVVCLTEGSPVVMVSGSGVIEMLHFRGTC